MHYQKIDDLVHMVEEPNRSALKRILLENRAIFEQTPGSTHNHQAWPGGYIDHVTDGMNYACELYALEERMGRPLPFTLSDVLLIFFLHDLEKPWRIIVANGGYENRAGLMTKAEFRAFREKKLDEYGVMLTPTQSNALTYVEGEGPDYSSTHRVMNELAGFCHMIDVWSARVRHDYPKEVQEDAWAGKYGRVRTHQRA